jgi:hypothetical protein
MDATFVQQKERKIHPEMLPSKALLRECRDSETHPKAIPVELWLDLTGSMHEIPMLLIKDGMPTIVSKLQQNGLEDGAFLFGGVGDHVYDKAPLQVGQFESGDAELDMWLTRTFIERGGGGNNGESYLLAWYFGAYHVKSDAMEKRNRKGYRFTIGDEPCLESIPLSALNEIMGGKAIGQGQYTRGQLLKASMENAYTYHIHVKHNAGVSSKVDGWWAEAFGQNLIVVDDYTTIPQVISDTIIANEQRISDSVSDDRDSALGTATRDGKSGVDLSDIKVTL